MNAEVPHGTHAVQGPQTAHGPQIPVAPRAEINNDMSNDRFDMFHVSDPVDPDMTTFHYRDGYEVHCTLEGGGLFFLDGREYVSAPGTVILVHYGHLCRIIRQVSPVFERMYFYVSPRLLREASTPRSDLEVCFRDAGSPVTRVVGMDLDALRVHARLLDEARREADAGAFGGDILLEHRFLDLMVDVNRVTRCSGNVLLQARGELSPLVDGVTRYINGHLTDDLTLDALADRFFTDKFHLSRAFKREVGITVHDFIVKKRLWMAKRLLLRGANAQTACVQSGFRTYTHFLRSFKNAYGMTPREFVARST
ncbi:AraC family transcriptional regulator [Bifidobacterium avesanii]|nr:AraC family transcriptional regulator [Bifidobacterium avesanii]